MQLIGLLGIKEKLKFPNSQESLCPSKRRPGGRLLSGWRGRESCSSSAPLVVVVVAVALVYKNHVLSGRLSTLSGLSLSLWGSARLQDASFSLCCRPPVVSRSPRRLHVLPKLLRTRPRPPSANSLNWHHVWRVGGGSPQCVCV